MKKSAKFIAQLLVGYTSKDVYDIWEDMGIVFKDKMGSWKITDLGRSIGGSMSKSDYSQPVFEEDIIIDKMIEFYNKTKGSKG
ncbi:MAG: hypothetical protein IKK51_03915 [Oscillospiraceae bacterium]|nr:hypothetical protein [Oscillospiraceae bacterium]